jgi:hypothetical protein
MRNGRVVAAFADELEAWVRMATNYDIPREKWPERFRDAQIPNKDDFEV